MSVKGRALLTGVTGQDGGHLAKLLHQKGYEVFGLSRGQRNPRCDAVVAKFPFVRIIEGDLIDPASLIRAVDQADPDELRNLAICGALGQDRPPLRTDPFRLRPNDPPLVVGDATRIEAEIGWIAHIDWQDSIEEYVRRSAGQVERGSGG